MPLRNPAAPEVLVAAVDVPRGLKSGEPFDLRADIESNVATTAKVNLYQNQFLVASANVALKPGRNEVRFPNLRAGDGFTAYEVEILPAADTRPENNRAGATVALGGSRACCSWTATRPRPRRWPGRLREAKIDVETRGPAGLPRTLERTPAVRPVHAQRRVRPADDAATRWSSTAPGCSSSAAGSS